MHANLQKSGLEYLMRVSFQVIIGIALFFVAAGDLTYLRGWIYFITYSISIIIGLIYLSKRNPEVLNERAKERSNTEPWDKVLLKFYILLAFFIIYIVAGLDIRFGWSHIPIVYMYPSLIILILSSIFGIWAMRENNNFEATSRIQKDRLQNVCDSGPYKIVRHPGYLAIILWAIVIPFIFGSLYMAIPSILILIVIVIRTYLEDKMLKEKLDGYIKYSRKTKYRLLPFIW